jgi:diguanylate cyclase (GGDEF)-like protein/PAS domain S-box-containing protein
LLTLGGHITYEQASIFSALLLTSSLSLFFYQQRRRAYLCLAASKEQALRASDARLLSFFAATPDALLISDAQGTITMANQQVEHLLGYSVDELVGKSIDELVPRRYRGNHPTQRSGFSGNPSARRMGYGLAVKARRKDGSECDVEVSLSRIETDEGLFFASALRDITVRVQSEEQLRIAAVAFESHQGVVVTDTNDVILRVNAAFSKITGYSADESIGKRMNFLKSGSHGEDFWAVLWDTILREGSWAGEIWNRNKSGEVHPHWLTIASVKDNKNNISHYIGTYTDITERLQAESDLAASETRLRTIIEHEPDCIELVNAQGRLIEMNPAGLAMIEADSMEQVVGLEIIDLVAPEFQSEFADLHRRVIAGESVRLKFKVVGLKGGHRWMDTHAVPMQDHGQPAHLAVTRDVTANQKAEADLRIAAAAFESQHGLVVTDANSVILRVNQAFTEITGYSAEEAIGQTPRLLKSGRHDASFYRSMWDALNSTDQWAGEIWDRRKNGEIYPKWLTISAVRDAGCDVTHYVGSHQDISDRKKAEEKITALAFFDQLTGLPNRTLLLDRLKQAMTSSGRSGAYGALLFIDLDNFKSLNDTLGHDMGDLLLKQVSQRLTGCVRDGDTVARLGGDEFVLILTSLSASKADAASGTETATEKILTALNESYQLGGHAHRSTASIGATLFQGQVATMDDLMKQADMAMYRAKEAGRNALRFFDPDMETAVLNRVALEKDLRQAIQEKQFFLHYQALVADAGHVTGAEVLARWHHPERGMVPPAEFIPLAEETGVILSLGHWVLETACKQLVLWAARPEMAHLTVAVNVSAHQFRQGDFVDQVLSVLKNTGASPHRLKLELTESFLVSNVEDTIAKMLLLKAQGVGFALDDFGTGYSSLTYLKRLPLNHLKIDSSFVRDVLIDPNDAAITRTIVALAQSLGLGVIAEGVETKAQRDFLATSGCHVYQGYFFSRPMTIEGFEAYAFTQHPSEPQCNEAVALVTCEKAAEQE